MSSSSSSSSMHVQGHGSMGIDEGDDDSNRLDDFQRKSSRDHVLIRPQMFLGSVEPTKQDLFIHHEKNNEITKHKGVVFNPGLMKIIDEAIDNAMDNVGRSPPTTVIRVDLDIEKNTVSVSNNGRHIPITKKVFTEGDPEEWIPSVIFGDCMSGSNFSDEGRTGAGMNGLGIKLANIMSSSFKVSCYDPTRELYFVQKWKDNMGVAGEPVIRENVKSPPRGKHRITCVEFSPRPEQFHGSRITKEVVDIVRTRLLGILGTIRSSKPLKVYLNGTRLMIASFRSFVSLFKPGKFFLDESHPQLKYAVAMSSTDTYEHTSFVNNVMTTSADSSELRTVTSAVTSALADHLKSSRGAGDSGGVSTYTIQSKLHVWVSLHMEAPNFDSQAKTRLTSSIRKIFKLDEAKLVSVAKASGLMKELIEATKKRALQSLSRSMNGSGRNRTVLVDNLDDAHVAGTARGNQATLMVCEGFSAKTFIMIGLSVVGRELYGVFPLKGKPINVRNATTSQLKNNPELVNLMKILNLRFGVDYESDLAFSELRYGRLCIITDADVDGSGHITGLLLNIFDKFWPSLIYGKRKFLCRFMTPIVKVTGPSKHVFYDTAEYDAFVQDKGEARMKRYNVQHLKGLGTSLREDTLSYFNAMNEFHLKEFDGRNNASRLFEFLFDKTGTEWRKRWLMKASCAKLQLDQEDDEFDQDEYDYGDDDDDADTVVFPTSYDVHAPTVDIAAYLNTEMLQYSLYSIQRSIPSAIDGLKVSQRKILFGFLKKFSRSSQTGEKVAQLAAYVASCTNYAHGEDSLQKAVVKLAQDFPGSNNVNLLDPLGSFGSRMLMGEDCAAGRYIYTRLTQNALELFPARDHVVLKNLVEENKLVEPAFYVPRLPVVLLNGTNGLATGFKSSVPCFNPDDIRALIDKITSNETLSDNDEPLPWYRNYRANDTTVSAGDSWEFRGKVRIEGGPLGSVSHRIVIDEIPVMVKVEKYKDKILTPLVDAKILTHFVVDHKSENEPTFIVYPGEKWPPEEDVLKTLKLTRTFSKRNMNLLDRHGKVVNFKKVVDIVKYWVELRKEFINLRIEFEKGDLDQKIEAMNHKLNFLRAIVIQDLDIRLDRIEVEKVMSEKLGIPKSFHTEFLNMPIMSITKDKIREAENAVADMVLCREDLNRWTPLHVLREEALKGNDSNLHNRDAKRIRREQEQFNALMADVEEDLSDIEMP